MVLHRQRPGSGQVRLPDLRPHRAGPGPQIIFGTPVQRPVYHGPLRRIYHFPVYGLPVKRNAAPERVMVPGPAHGRLGQGHHPADAAVPHPGPETLAPEERAGTAHLLAAPGAGHHQGKRPAPDAAAGGNTGRYLSCRVQRHHQLYDLPDAQPDAGGKSWNPCCGTSCATRKPMPKRRNSC